MKLTRSANIIEVDVNGRKYSKVNYSVPEEIANCVTHGLPILFYIAGLIYMLTISFDARTYATSIITCLSAITVYTISTIYHAVQDTVKKYYWRKVDHSDVPFLVIGCSCAVCLLLSTHVYNYIALGVSFCIAFISVALSVTNVDKFKAVTMTLDFVIGAVMLAAFIINFSYIPHAVRILYLSGALLCIAGSILFGIKLRFVHAVFHVFITAGTICFYVASLLLMQNYHGF